MNLDALRQEIDGLDSQLVSLFLRRMELSGQVARYKQDRGLPVLDAARQQALLHRIETLAGAEYSDYARPLYQTILTVSRSRQNQLLRPACGLARRLQALSEQGGALPANAKVACLSGQEDAARWACQALFDAPKICLYHSRENIVQAAAGECQYGVLPALSDDAGAMSKTFDLLARYGCHIVRGLSPLPVHTEKADGEPAQRGPRFLCVAPAPAVYPGADRMALMLTLPPGEEHLQSLLTLLAIHGARPIQLESRMETDGDFSRVCYLELALDGGSFVRLITDLEAECGTLTHLGTYSYYAEQSGG